MDFLSNGNTTNHKTRIVESLRKSDEAYFAVAFLKNSGLNLIFNEIIDFLKKGGRLTMIAGQNFGLTEPTALHELRKLFQKYPQSKIYLAKANATNSVFHPKLYLFKSKDGCSIISGSANVTQGGLTTNKETSLVSNCMESDRVWIDAFSYYQVLTSADSADEATLLVIKQYETFFEQQKQYNRKAKSIPNRTKSQIAFDYNNLLKHFQKFDTAKRESNFNEKMENYRAAKRVLDEIADTSGLTQKQFEPLLDSLVGSKEDYSLWHSGSLFRLRRSVYPYFKEFQSLIKFIRENKNQSASMVFGNAVNKVKGIEGASVNYITEIMMTYNPNAFANMNKNPLTVLRKEAGVNIKASTSSYFGTDYEEYCNLIKEIVSKLGLHNMLEADSFFNDIYWKIKK